jgi:predicted Zn-dependent peptidase
VEAIRTTPVAGAELESAKRSVLAGRAFALAEPPGVLEHIVMERLLSLPAGYWNNYTARVTAVGADDVVRVARRYLDVSGMQIVVVADQIALREVREQFDPPPSAGTSETSGPQRRP